MPLRSKLYEDMDITEAEARAANLHWLGSDYFITTAGYYGTMRTETLLADFAYSADNAREYAADPGKGGRPTCNELWTKLSTDIVAQAETDGVVGYWEEMWGVSNDEKAKIVQRYVETAEQRAVQSADEINAMRQGEQGFWGQAANWAGGQVSNLALGALVLLLESTVNAVIYGAATIQAYILMAIYLFIPIGMLASRYSPVFLISGGLLIFSVIFWTALWAIAAQADLFLAGSFWNIDSSDVEMAITDPENMTKKLIHSIVVLMLYTVLPVAVSWVLMAAGSSAGMALSNATRSMSMGANVGNSAASKTMIGGGKGSVGLGKTAYKAFKK